MSSAYSDHTFPLPKCFGEYSHKDKGCILPYYCSVHRACYEKKHGKRHEEEVPRPECFGGDLASEKCDGCEHGVECGREYAKRKAEETITTAAVSHSSSAHVATPGCYGHKRLGVSVCDDCRVSSTCPPFGSTSSVASCFGHMDKAPGTSRPIAEKCVACRFRDDCLVKTGRLEEEKKKPPRTCFGHFKDEGDHGICVIDPGCPVPFACFEEFTKKAEATTISKDPSTFVKIKPDLLKKGFTRADVLDAVKRFGKREWVGPIISPGCFANPNIVSREYVCPVCEFYDNCSEVIKRRAERGDPPECYGAYVDDSPTCSTSSCDFSLQCFAKATGKEISAKLRERRERLKSGSIDDVRSAFDKAKKS